MYRWIQPEDGAMPWEDAVRAMPPAAKNTTDLRVTDTERFRINFSMEGRDNYGALQLGDITLKAYHAQHLFRITRPCRANRVTCGTLGIA